MTGKTQPSQMTVDVLVVGSGAAGFTAAIVSKKAGLEVLLVEKEDVLGGTTAFSGGVLWIPGNRHSKTLGPDSREAARSYIQAEAGNHFNAARVDAFLDTGPELVEFLERETEVEFYPMPYPDYHQDYPGASTIRSIGTKDYNPSRLGKMRTRLRRGLTQQDFLGLAVGSNVEMRALMTAGRSLSGFLFVIRKFGKVICDVLRYGRPEPVVRGRALIARLMRTAMDLDLPMWLSSPVWELVRKDGRVVGAVVQHEGRRVLVLVRRGVVLASGGFPHDGERTEKLYPHRAAGRTHIPMAPPGNTGDGARLAESAGGSVDTDVVQPAAWMPVSLIPGRTGPRANWQHIVDRQKPGFIAVTPDARRFTNESQPYHHFVPALVHACARMQDTYCYLIADHAAVRKYGMGFMKPAPIPGGHHVRSGYILRGDTLADLARQAGLDPAELVRTVERFNAHARQGNDPDFHRGANAYDQSQGDPDHKPNPNLAPLETGPYYAVKVFPGDIGTFSGIRVDADARALDGNGDPIPGLYAAGNDCLNVVSGGYAGAGGTLGPGMTYAYLAARHLASGAAVVA
ncbi:3-oxosteroid 1-dehydrogenase [Sphingobium lactosutens]|uniref:FAD-dependent oxidoreductase n=1 Tax=Sphingobium lactosutens TaxID=522773 RepID=UPI0015BFEEB1|nr:FAD-dependent oxidoreductase [Sphingobium lactosutens]NWK99118.1 3-oxosteroid 1-dehydrogenase [Sphingobium lactosutens]